MILNKKIDKTCITQSVVSTVIDNILLEKIELKGQMFN